MKLAIVVGTPLTTEWIWERNQAAKDRRGLDELPYDETDTIVVALRLDIAPRSPTSRTKILKAARSS